MAHGNIYTYRSNEIISHVMKGDTISYYECKYSLAEPYSVAVSIYPDTDISVRYVKLTKEGLLTIGEGFPWDGPSGPTQDTPDGMRASLIHDACYALMCAGQLDDKWRSAADAVFHAILLEDGMGDDPRDGRADLWHKAVQEFGGPHAREPKVALIAPRPMEPYRPEYPGD